MGRLIAVVFLVIACATVARAQQGPQTSQNQAILSAANQSVTLNPSFPAQTCTFTVSQVTNAQYTAPFVGTITFYESGDGSTFQALGRATSPGNFVYSCGGYYTLKATMTSYTSGAATVLVVASPIGLSAITTASGIIPNSQAQATFGGSYPYIFPNGISQTNIVGPVFNVTNAAAYGNPTPAGTQIDYTTPTRNALAAAAAAGGGTVYFPCFGQYGIGGAGETVPANVTVEGCGASSVIVPLPALTAPVFTAYEANDVTFRNLECEGMTLTPANNVAASCFENAGSSTTRFENLNGFYINGPLIKMIGVNTSNYAFINIATNIQCNQSIGCISGDDSASDFSQAAQSLTFIGTNIGANNQIGSTEAFYFKDSHDVYLNNPYVSWGFGAQTGTGIGLHVVGDTGPVLVNGFDAQSGTGSPILQVDANTSGDLTPPARVMITTSLFENSTGGVVLNAGTQFGFTNNVFIGIQGTTTYPCALCVAAGVTDVRLADNSFSANGQGSVSPFYTIKNLSTGALSVSHNTFSDTGISGIVSNGSGNFMQFRDNTVTSNNNVVSNTKPYSIANNIGLVNSIPQDWSVDSSGDTKQTGYLTVANNFFSSGPAPNNQQATLLGWNGTGSGDAVIATQFYNSNTALPVFSVYAPMSSTTGYQPEAEVMRNGGYYDAVTQRYAIGLTYGATTPVHPGEIANTIGYTASSTAVTFPNSFAFTSTAYYCQLTAAAGPAVALSYTINSASQITILSAASSGNVTYDCKGAT